MFGFFKKKKTHPLPDRYKHLIDRDDYHTFLELCLQSLEQAGEKIVRAADGELSAAPDADGNVRRYYLDNLIRVVVQREKGEWPQVVTEHFGKQRVIPHALEYLYSDFDYAAQFVKAYIKADDFPDLQQYLYRVDLPGTCTMLILDFDEKFHFLTRENIAAWGKSEDELFALGFSNISNEQIDINESQMNETYPMFTFFSGDFSATYIIELERNADFTIGTHGCLLAIPTKGSAFIHPIEGPEVMNVVEQLSGVIVKFFEEDPGCITTRFYWFYDGVFELFPEEVTADGDVVVSCPDKLRGRLDIAPEA
jgi:hypothetical protein